MICKHAIISPKTWIYSATRTRYDKAVRHAGTSNKRGGVQANAKL